MSKKIKRIRDDENPLTIKKVLEVGKVNCVTSKPEVYHIWRENFWMVPILVKILAIILDKTCQILQNFSRKPKKDCYKFFEFTEDVSYLVNSKPKSPQSRFSECLNCCI